MWVNCPKWKKKNEKIKNVTKNHKILKKSKMSSKIKKKYKKQIIKNWKY